MFPLQDSQTPSIPFGAALGTFKSLEQLEMYLGPNSRVEFVELQIIDRRSDLKGFPSAKEKVLFGKLQF